MKRRTLGSTVFGLCVAVFIAGCGAGQITQTDTQIAAVNGSSAQVGRIAIRNAELTVPSGAESAVLRPGSDAAVRMIIVNDGSRDDELVSARSNAAANVSVSGSRTVGAGSLLVFEPGVPDPGQFPEGMVTLQGMTRDVRPGQLVPLTLTFRDAGEVTFDVPGSVPEPPRDGSGGRP